MAEAGIEVDHRLVGVVGFECTSVARYDLSGCPSNRLDVEEFEVYPDNGFRSKAGEDCSGGVRDSERRSACGVRTIQGKGFYLLTGLDPAESLRDHRAEGTHVSRGIGRASISSSVGSLLFSFW